MKLKLKTGVATAALIIAACSVSPVYAGGLFDRGGSTKDDYVPYVREISTGAGPCYFRADVGYSLSSDPEIKWPVNNQERFYDDTGAAGYTGEAITSSISTFITDTVSGSEMDNTWFGEAGFGCGSGSRGLRAEVMFGVRGSRDIDGKPGDFAVTYTANTGGSVVDPPVDDPLHTSLRSYTMMLNVYKDLGNYGRFTPYVGAGAGLAYHKLSETYFTGNPNLTNRIRGNSDLAFAWSVMAGVGYQISDRAVLDLGYRFIDMGSISSGRADSAGFVNPAVDIDDLRAHEFKVGVRYHFGGEERSYK